jgi:soluble lytic murein transglycosylase-like protein
MSQIMWRESRCEPAVRSRTSDTGLLQINDINHPYLRRALGEWVDRWTLTDPAQNVRAAAALCTYWQQAGAGCLQPWKATR